MRGIVSDLNLTGHKISQLADGALADDALTLGQFYDAKSLTILTPQAGDRVTLFITHQQVRYRGAKGFSRISGGGSGNTVQFRLRTYDSPDGSPLLTLISQTWDTDDGIVTLSGSTKLNADIIVVLDVVNVVGTVDEFHLTTFFDLT